MISISEIHGYKNGQKLVLRSVYEHFYDLSRDQQWKLDAIEVQKEIVDVVKKTKVKKTVNMRALPIIYLSDHVEMGKVETENAQEQTEAKVNKLIEDFDKIAKRYIDILHESGFPSRCCGKRSNCCGYAMNSLFHECKQMGIVLRKSFKGSHIWIPPISK